MAKKFGKFLMVTATLSAIAAGAYYFFRKKDVADDDFYDDDDFDEFDEDLDEGDAAKTEADRKYVDLDLSKATDAAEEKGEEFKEGLEAAKAEASDKIVGAVEEKAGGKEDVFFDDEDEDNSSDAT